MEIRAWSSCVKEGGLMEEKITCPIEPSDTINKMKEKLKEAINKFGYDEVRKSLEGAIFINEAINGPMHEWCRLKLGLNLLKELEKKKLEEVI
jgi:hypothetical protein